MPNFRDLTPEQRAENVRKAQETRERKRAERDAKKAAREARPTRRGLSKVQVKNGVTLIVVGLDAAFAYGAPKLWVTPEDRLNEQEVELLAEAFSTEAVKSARAMRLLAMLTDFSGRLGIAGALMIVALPRLIRRGLIPEPWVPVIRKLIGAATAKETEEAAPEPEIPPREEPAPDRQAA